MLYFVVHFSFFRSAFQQQPHHHNAHNLPDRQGEMAKQVKQMESLFDTPDDGEEDEYESDEYDEYDDDDHYDDDHYDDEGEEDYDNYEYNEESEESEESEEREKNDQNDPSSEQSGQRGEWRDIPVETVNDLSHKDFVARYVKS